MFKWLQRYFEEPNALWRQIISEKYGYDSSLIFSDLSVPPHRVPLKLICKSILNHPSANFFGKSLISGEWLSNELLEGNLVRGMCFEIKFPRLFSIAINPDASIASMGIWDRMLWHWIFSWRRELRPRDVKNKIICWSYCKMSR